MGGKNVLSSKMQCTSEYCIIALFVFHSQLEHFKVVIVIIVTIVIIIIIIECISSSKYFSMLANPPSSVRGK